MKIQNFLRVMRQGATALGMAGLLTSGALAGNPCEAFEFDQDLVANENYETSVRITKMRFIEKGPGEDPELQFYVLFDAAGTGSLGTTVRLGVSIEDAELGPGETRDFSACAQLGPFDNLRDDAAYRVRVRLRGGSNYDFGGLLPEAKYGVYARTALTGNGGVFYQDHNNRNNKSKKVRKYWTKLRKKRIRVADLGDGDVQLSYRLKNIGNRSTGPLTMHYSTEGFAASESDDEGIGRRRRNDDGERVDQKTDYSFVFPGEIELDKNEPDPVIDDQDADDDDGDTIIDFPQKAEFQTDDPVVIAFPDREKIKVVVRDTLGRRMAKIVRRVPTSVNDDNDDDDDGVDDGDIDVDVDPDPDEGPNYLITSVGLNADDFSEGKFLVAATVCNYGEGEAEPGTNTSLEWGNPQLDGEAYVNTDDLTAFLGRIPPGEGRTTMLRFELGGNLDSSSRPSRVWGEASLRNPPAGDADRDHESVDYEFTLPEPEPEDPPPPVITQLKLEVGTIDPRFAGRNGKLSLGVGLYNCGGDANHVSYSVRVQGLDPAPCCSDDVVIEDGIESGKSHTAAAQRFILAPDAWPQEDGDNREFKVTVTGVATYGSEDQFQMEFSEEAVVSISTVYPHPDVDVFTMPAPNGNPATANYTQVPVSGAMVYCVTGIGSGTFDQYTILQNGGRVPLRPDDSAQLSEGPSYDSRDQDVTGSDFGSDSDDPEEVERQDFIPTRHAFEINCDRFAAAQGQIGVSASLGTFPTEQYDSNNAARFTLRLAQGVCPDVDPSLTVDITP